MPKLGGIYVSVRARSDKYKRDLAEAKTLTRKAVIIMQHKISSISFKQVAVAAAAFGAVVVKLGLDGFRAMEKLKLSAASMASTITSFAKDADKDLAGTYQQALGYSEQLVLEMEVLNAKTVATGENLTAMVETLAQGGVLLDINNKKQVQGFLAIANALALVTQGQNADIQFRQEIRGLINGEVRATNALARILSQKVGGNLKDHVKLWKEQGTLIESAGALLAGFQEGAKDLSSTWLAVSTTLQTMYDRTLRGLIAPVYEDIIEMGKEITVNVLDQNSALNRNGVLLKTVVFKGWQDIKNITEVTTDLVAAFEAPLLVIGRLLSLIIDGWGMIFAILPAITERIKLITQAVFDSAKMLYAFSIAIRDLMFGNFDEALTAWETGKSKWNDSGRKTADAFSGGFLNEIDERLRTFNKDLTVKAKTIVDPPDLDETSDVDKDKELKKLQKANRKKYAMVIALARLVEDDTWLIRQEGLDKAIIQHANTQQDITQIEYDELLKRLDVQEEFNTKYEELSLSRFDIERLQLERQMEIYREAGVEKNKIDEMSSKRSTEIAQAEQQAKLSIYQDIAGGIADTFQMIAQAGGKQSLEAFRAYQAFSIIEAGIAGEKAVSLVLADSTITSTYAKFAMAAVVGAKAALQVGLIASASPPSFDNGGISRPGEIYQTGPIRELHIPMSGKNAVDIGGGNQEQKPPEVNIFNTIDPSVMDQYLASSRGTNAIFNSIGSQPQKLRRLTR